MSSPRNPWPPWPVMHMSCGCGIHSLPLQARANTAAIPSVTAEAGGRKSSVIGATGFPEGSWEVKRDESGRMKEADLTKKVGVGAGGGGVVGGCRPRET